MNIITPKINPITCNYPMIFYIDSTYNVTGIGIVLSGTLKYGNIQLGQKLYLGPINNTYIPITVKTMHNCISQHINMLKENESGCIGIRLDTKGSFTREMFSKGQIVTSDRDFALSYTCYSFNCDVAIFNHPTTIKNGFQSVIHSGTIRQTAKFKIDADKVLRTNSRENINIKFLFRPEFILPGTLFMFRDSKTKGMGRINYGVPFTEDTPELLTKNRRGNRKRSEKKQIKLEKVSGHVTLSKQSKPAFKKKPAVVNI